VTATFTVLAALYRHAYTQRADLALTPLEELDTRVDVYRNLALAGVGVLSIVVAALTGRFAPRLLGLAGYVYGVIGLTEWLLGEYRGRAGRKLATQ
jgi:hypothetical protein